MADYAPLSKPSHSQVSFNPTPQEPPSEGFNYPAFRLLNKQARVNIAESWVPDGSIPYKLFAVANHKGWFAALRITNTSTFELILSPLQDLRSAYVDAKSDDTSLFSPKRLVPLPAKPNILTFAESDSRLFVAFEQGSVAVYDTSILFTPGTGDIQPLCNNHEQDSPFKQILPNPGNEPGSSHLVAAVGNGKVHLWNSRLESEGGWVSGGLDSHPIAAAWSPRGKQIAIGLQNGDILTFALSNKTTPHKHIPPTETGVLISLNWLGPGHTFKTSYVADSDSLPKQHIVILDPKALTAIYYAPEHPYPAPERTQPSSYTLAFPKWDEEPSSPGAEVNLTVIADISSSDLEILGNIGTKWYRQVLDNPLSLPLDKNMEDTYILALEADLTDTESGMAVMYAYLSDGTVTAWHLEGSKPYSRVGATGAAAATTTTTAARDSDMGAEQTSTPVSTSPFGATTSSAFGTPSFGQTTSPTVSPPAATTPPAFGQSSFGQSSGFGAFAGSTPNAFGAAAGSPPSAFGTPAAVKPATAGGFGAFSGGGFSGFGAAAANNATGGFGSNGGAFGANNNNSGAFGSANNTGAFGSGSSATSGSTGFGSAANNTPSAFGSTGFGSANNTTNNAFGGSTNAFGSGSGAFGSTPSTTSAFGSAPSTTGAFGGFGSTTSSNNVFGQPAFGAPTNAQAPSQSASSNSLAPPSSTSMTREASMSDDSGAAPSGFGGLGLGSSTPNSTNAVNSMFGAFSTPAKPAEPSSSSAFGSAAGSGFLKPATAFGSALGQNSPFSLNKPATPSAGTVNAFATDNKPSAITPSSSGFGQSGFGAPAFGKTAFGTPSTLGSTTPAAAAQPTFGSTGFGAKTGGFGAFAGASTGFKPAAATAAPSSGGFASFANTGTPGFGKAAENVTVKKEEVEKTPTPAPAMPTGFAGFANATPGGFTSSSFVIAKKEEEPKKVEEVKKEETRKPFTSVFGTPTTGGTSSSSSLQNSEDNSVFRKPSERFAPSPPDSPTPAPAAIPPVFGGAKPVIASSPSSSPSSSPVMFGKSVSTPPAAAGSPATPPAAPSTPAHAFSNIKVSPSPFKLPAGYGAFGSTPPSSSPFSLKKPEETPTKVTAFGHAGSTTSPTPSSSGFGSTGFGFGMTPSNSGGYGTTFGETTPLGTKIITKSIFGTHEAYTAFPLNPALLSGNVTPAPATPATPAKEPASGGFGAFSGSSSPFGQLKKEQKTSFSDLLKTGGEARKDEKGKEKDDDETVKLKAREDGKDEGVKTDGEEEGEEHEGKGKSLASTRGERSYASVLASSVGSSFVEVSREEGASDEDGDGEERPYTDEDEPPEEYEEETYSDEESDDYEESFPEDEEYVPEGDENEGDDEDEGNERPMAKSRTPTSVPLPLSRSPSLTPQPEVPSVEVSPSPRQGSTTPPGTPARDKSPLGGTPGPSSLGLGRPSTRPVRSSPLANNTVSADEHKDEEGSPSAAKRPRTPPLLSSFNITAPTPVAPGAGGPSILKPASPFASDASSAKPAAAPAQFSLYGKPGGNPFGKQPAVANPEPTKPISAFGGPVFGQPSGSAKLTPPTFGGGIGLGAPSKAATGATTATSPPSTSPFGNLPPFSLKPGSTPPSLFSGAAASAPTPPQPSASAPPTAAAGLGLFGLPPPTIPNFGKPAAPQSSFGKPAAAPMGGFGKPTAIPTLPTFGVPGSPGQPPAPNASAPPSAVPAPMKSLMSTPPPPPLVRAQGEELEGMQKECADLVDAMEKDLQDLRRMGELTLQKCAMLKVAKPPQTKADVSSPEKWNFSSLTQFGDALREFQDDLGYLESQRSKLKASLKELQNNLLKAGTRKEEIARFNKAQHDPEFAKMLKARTLGPEHSETQMQLRKSIRILRDRIHKLESHLQDSKKKLAANISGKPVFKAPSIDTINRTYRNIDSLIQQQTAEVNHLASRVSKIDVNDLPSSPRKGASASDSRKGYQVSPNVAITTAAALNAERSAHKLKKALLAVRKEPLLNKKVESAPAAPTAFNSPQKPAPAPGSFAFQTPIKGSLFGDLPSATAADADALPEFKLPTDEDAFSPGTLSTSSGRRGAGGQRKHQSVPLKRTPGATPPAPAASFDWGPLPTFNTPKPAGSLFVPITSPGSPSTPKR